MTGKDQNCMIFMDFYVGINELKTSYMNENKESFFIKIKIY